jgi:mannose-1-phosphate guanylyltransferase
MRSRVFLAALASHLPQVAEPLDRFVVRGLADPGALEAFYGESLSISMDYGVMERADNVLTVRSVFPWDDLGSWSALERVRPAEDGVVSHGRLVALDCEGSIAYADQGLIAILGVKDLIVVRTDRATLVLPKDRAQEVRRIVQSIVSSDQEEYL